MAGDADQAANSGPKQEKAGRFQKGCSGNPAGKRKGTRHRATVMLEKILQGGAQEVAEAVVTAAKGGDMTAARLVLERIVPPAKGRRVELNLPAIETAADLLSATTEVIAAMARGQITAEEAATISGVLELRRKAVETVDIERRLAALEGRAK